MSKGVYAEMHRKLSESERLARSIAKQMGQDPDQLIALGHPPMLHVPHGPYHIVDVGQLRPLWTVYIDLARAALEAELK